jgi:hypothetical protein
MQLGLSAAIIGSTPRPHLGPVALTHLGDIERLFGEDVIPGVPWHASSPALVAAALALLEDVPRIVVADSLAAVAEEVRLVLVPGALTREARAALAAPTPEVPVYADLPDDPTLDEIRHARARGVRFVHPGGSVLLPGRRRAIPVGGAALALPLMLGRRALAPISGLTPVRTADHLGPAGVLCLETRTLGHGAPRVVLGAGATPLVPAR